MSISRLADNVSLLLLGKLSIEEQIFYVCNFAKALLVKMKKKKKMTDLLFLY